MPRHRPELLDFFLTRRSRPAKTLVAPGPEEAELKLLLEAALRVPDHGKLEPWRLIVLQDAALARLADLVRSLGPKAGLDAAKTEKQADAFARGVCVVAVVACPKASDKIPASEQRDSAAAACMSLLSTALATGWGANWLTGWAAHDRGFLTKGLDLAAGENLVGFIHIGTETTTPPERPRPDVAALTQWMDR